MTNDTLILTTISIPQFKDLLREQIEDFFNTTPSQKNESVDEIGGIELAIEITGLAKPTIYSLTSNRAIPHCKRNKKLYFSRQALTEWITNGKRMTRVEIKENALQY